MIDFVHAQWDLGGKHTKIQPINQSLNQYEIMSQLSPLAVLWYYCNVYRSIQEGALQRSSNSQNSNEVKENTYFYQVYFSIINSNSLTIVS